MSKQRISGQFEYTKEGYTIFYPTKEELKILEYDNNVFHRRNSSKNKRGTFERLDSSTTIYFPHEDEYDLLEYTELMKDSQVRINVGVSKDLTAPPQSTFPVRMSMICSNVILKEKHQM